MHMIVWILSSLILCFQVYAFGFQGNVHLLDETVDQIANSVIQNATLELQSRGINASQSRLAQVDTDFRTQAKIIIAANAKSFRDQRAQLNKRSIFKGSLIASATQAAKKTIGQLKAVLHSIYQKRFGINAGPRLNKRYAV